MLIKVTFLEREACSRVQERLKVGERGGAKVMASPVRGQLMAWAGGGLEWSVGMGLRGRQG